MPLYQGFFVVVCVCPTRVPDIRIPMENGIVLLMCGEEFII